MMNLRTTLLTIVLTTVGLSPLLAQQSHRGGFQPESRFISINGAEEDPITVQFPDADIDAVLRVYEEYTGRKVIRSPSANGQNITINSDVPMSKGEAAEFIELTLQQYGFTIVPTQNPRQFKLVPTGNTTSSISSEFIPTIRNELEIPRTEEIVSFVARLRYIPASQAAAAVTQHIDLHSYGRIVPVDASRSLIITESGHTLRRILSTLKEIDIRVEPTIDKLFVMVRATSDDVVAALSDIYSGESNTPQATPAAVRGQPAPQAGGNARQPTIPSPSAGASPDAPKFTSIGRANSVLVIATPDEMVNIERLIGYLDAPAELNNFIRLQLNYLSVSSFLDIAGDALTRGLTEATDEVSGQTDNNNNNQANNQGNNNNQGGLGTSASAATLGTLTEENVGPQSLVVGKTLLVADNDHNALIASGPPESLHLIKELVREMDIRSPQIQISAVIAQLDLGDDFDYGINFLKSLNGNNRTAGSLFSSSSAPFVDLVDTLTDTALTGAASSTGLNVLTQIGPSLDGFINLMESTSRFKVLSKPVVYTLNNRRAVIQTGQRIAVPRSTLSSLDTGNVTANIDFENVLLRLEVIPLINNDGQVTLRINQSNDGLGGTTIIGGDAIPNITTQALGTTIMVPDGETVLLGGLISEGDRRDESGLPLFTNFPFVGRVFGARGDEVDRQELLIMIQPRIISSVGEYLCADEDILNRTRIGTDTVEFSKGKVDNRPAFEAREWESPEKRLDDSNTGLKNFFQKLKNKRKPSAHARPYKRRP